MNYLDMFGCHSLRRNLACNCIGMNPGGSCKYHRSGRKVYSLGIHQYLQANKNKLISNNFNKFAVHVLE